MGFEKNFETGERKSTIKLSEVLSMKNRVEEVILKELQIFQKNTGLSISGINIDLTHCISGESFIRNVNVVVEL